MRTHRLLAAVLTLGMCVLPVRARAANAGSPAPAPWPDTSRQVGPLTLVGYVQADTHLFESAPGQAGPADRFAFRRARLYVSGTLGSRIGWRVSAGASKWSAASALLDAYIQLAWLPFVSVRIGQFKTPYGLEGSTSSEHFAFMERSTFAETEPVRDIGVMVASRFRHFKALSYEIGVFNGSGPNRFDNNASKDLAGRVVYTPGDMPGVGIGFSWTSGREPDGVRRRWGGDVSYRHRWLKLAVEYGHRTIRPATGPRQDADGWYAEAVRRFRPRGRHAPFYREAIALRFDHYLDTVPLVRRDAVTLGFNHYFSRDLKGMIDYIVLTRRSPGMERGALYFRMQVDY